MGQANATIRTAAIGDEVTIADLQIAVWDRALGPVMAGLIPRDQIRSKWHSWVHEPESPDHQVLAAEHNDEIVGFVALAPGGEIVAMEISPDHRGEGFAGQLIDEVVELLHAEGEKQLHAWALAGDDAREEFLANRGFAKDGVERTLEGPADGVLEKRWTLPLY